MLNIIFIRPITKLILLILFLPIIMGVCFEGQININNASKNDLMKIKWVGNVTAQYIIDYRNQKPFNSLDDLIFIKGIGEKKLSDIKNEGKACVTSKTEEGVINKENNKMNKTNNQNNSVLINNPINNSNLINQSLYNITQDQIIRLNSKNIKTRLNSNFKGENYAIYWLVSFSILVVVLFILKKKI